MYANNGMKVKVPAVDCSDDDCFLDFDLRVRKRMKYPGACSLYYQSAIQAIYELLGWDPIHNCSKGVGIFGLVDAIGRADEEQNRGTLHGHILVWLRNFGEILKLLFDSDTEKRESAREALRSFVDHHFHSDYDYEEGLEVIHEECEESGTIDEMFSEVELQDLRDCRHKDLAHKYAGKILSCNRCESSVTNDNSRTLKNRISPVELNNAVLKTYWNRRDSDMSSENEEPQVTFPPNNLRTDIMTYRYPIDVDQMSPNCEDFFTILKPGVMLQ